MAEHIFDSTLQKTIEWFGDVKQELHWEKDREVYSATVAVLQTLRDRLSVEEAVQLAAQLPMLLRGAYFEDYSPHEKPDKDIKSLMDFYVRVQEKSVFQFDSKRAASAVLAVLKKRISSGEIEDIVSGLPEDLKTLFTS